MPRKLFLDNHRKRERRPSVGADHFAAKGANDRVWNSLEKLCRVDPALFARYHANGWIDIAAEAWLGPAYQVTAQVNLVHPGGAAQEAHCDYHLGFMTQEQVAQYPPHVHALSAQLTLQGAIAHCDMPVESGTTKLLPGSQNWPENYLRYRDEDVRAIFDKHHVQLPLEKGDLLFFSPGNAARRRRQPHSRHRAYGQPDADLLRLRHSSGSCRPGVDVQAGLSGSGGKRSVGAGESLGNQILLGWATPSPPISTPTRRSAASPRRHNRR